MDLSRRMPVFIAAMAVLVTLSNYLVQFPFRHFGMGDLLTWGAFTYPVTYLVNDLTNRQFGNEGAKRVIYVGFAFAVVLSIIFASPRIAVASGIAFLVAQLLNMGIFDRLRLGRWWRAPLYSTLIGSAIDNAMFFSLAFAQSTAFLDTLTGRPDNSLATPVPFPGGTEIPLWASLAIGDFFLKVAIGLVMLVPYGALMRSIAIPAAPKKHEKALAKSLESGGA
jgi:queuosine precursor transporter